MRDRIDRHDRGLGDPLVSPGRVQPDREAERAEVRAVDVRAAEARGESRGDRDLIEPEAPLFAPEEATQLRTRWESVQAGFVDEPRRAVEEADGLVRTVMDRLTNGFTSQRERLEREWDSRDEVSTEDLRQALQHYRTFFDRLLNM